MTKLPLTKLSPNAARIQTLVARHAEGLAFESGGAAWRVVPAPGMAAGGASALCRTGDVDITAWLDEAGWRAAAATALECPPGSVDAFPGTLVRAALECFFAGALAGAEKAMGQAVSLEKFEVKQANVPASACRVGFERQDGFRIGLAWVAGRADDGWFQSLADCLARLPAAERELPGDLPLAGEVGLGGWAVPASLPAGIGVGDVLITPCSGERVLTVGGAVRFAAALENGILSVEGKTMTHAAGAPEAEAQEDTGQQPVSVDNVEVELQARVGRLTVTLAQLRQLGAGQVVEFSTPVESPVTLTAMGRPIATGELVDVGGRIGVRITAMAEK